MTEQYSTSQEPGRPTRRQPVEGTPLYVDQPAQLEELCRGWHDLDVLGVDTEFVRERTFYPGLGLIQICDGEQNLLIDPLAIADLGPLQEVFANEQVLKIFHSCSEDMETLYHHLGEVPKPVFDTQLAASLAGFGYSLGLSGLTTLLFNVEIPKQQTRTNWLRRPLSEAQKQYAGLDVAYLLPIHERLASRLAELGRTTWAEEDFAAFRDTARFDTDPANAFDKFRRMRGLDRRRLAILRSLAIWRETEARKRNLARNFVLRENVMPILARKRPKGYGALKAIPELRPDELRRHGRTIVRLVEEAMELPESEIPERLPQPIDLTPHKKSLDRMRKLVMNTAAELELPAELLATRRTVEKLARRGIQGRDPLLPEELEGWRRQVVGDRLAEIAMILSDGGESSTDVEL